MAVDITQSVLGLVLISTMVILPAAAVPFRTEFESPTYNLGGLPQDAWTGAGQIQDDDPSVVEGGEQSLEILESSIVSRSFVGPTSGKVYVDGYYQGPTVTIAPDPTTLGAGSSLVLFHATDGIQALNGNGTGGGAWVSTGVQVSGNGLQRITICQDYTAKNWTLYIDGQLIPGTFGFKNNSITRLNGIDIETPETGKGYLDRFAATTSVPDFFSNALFDFSREWIQDEDAENWDLVPAAGVDAADLSDLIGRIRSN